MGTQGYLETDSWLFTAQITHANGANWEIFSGNRWFSISRDHRKKGEVYGYDGGKQVKGRKRHLVVDSQGLLIGILVTGANASERLGAAVVLHEATEELSQTQVVWVDNGYSGENFARVVKQICGARVEVIQRVAQTFEILPKRWIVERTFGWLNRYRREARIMNCIVSQAKPWFTVL